MAAEKKVISQQGKDYESIIRTLNFYGKIYYQWDLNTDALLWRGPMDLIVENRLKILTGDLFASHLSVKDYEKRMEAVSTSFQSNKPLKLDTIFRLPNGEYCRLEEVSQPYFSRDRRPSHLLGMMRVHPLGKGEKIETEKVSGKDKLTGLSNRLGLVKDLEKCITQATKKKTVGAYLSVTIDHLAPISAMSNFSTMNTIIKFVGKSLKDGIRDTDFMGRIGGNCFGLILNECDRWGVVTASNRLIDAIQNYTIQTPVQPIQVTVSTGAVVFPSRTFTASEILNEADLALAETQNTKGAAAYWKGMLDTPLPDKPKEADMPKTKGKQRRTDGKK
ncbi:MAG: GGDEF domain-containing protein [bacterium]|nr:GGDEF domain-containing protein [bacterium]